jgi:type IV pilus assembly protein PilM
MRILGIELGSWAVKAVEIESRFRRVDILDIHEVRLPLEIIDPIATYKSAVEQIMARLPVHPEKISTSIPPSQTALRFLQIPVKQRKTVEKMFRFELEDNFPLKLEDCILEHHIYRILDGNLVFAAAAPKKHITAHLEWLKNIGLDPDWLVFDGMGLINLYLGQFESKKDPGITSSPNLIIDIGHSKTNIAVIDGDRLELFRSIPWGGLSISRSISLTLGLPLPDAEQLKINSLDLDEPEKEKDEEPDDLVIATKQSLTNLITDINHSLVSYKNNYKREVSGIVLSGGTSKLKGLSTYLENQTHLEVKIFSPYKNLNIKEDLKQNEANRFGEALGRAFVFDRKASLLFNFRKLEMAKGTSLTEVTMLLQNPSVLKSIKYAALVAIILFANALLNQLLATRETSTASSELQKVFQDTFKNTPPKLKKSLTSDLGQFKKFIKQKTTELDQKIKLLSKSRASTSNILLALSNSFPPEVKVDVNSIQISEQNFSLEGVLFSGNLDSVTENLKNNATFKNVSLSKQNQRFSYKGEIQRK